MFPPSVATSSSTLSMASSSCSALLPSAAASSFALSPSAASSSSTSSPSAAPSCDISVDVSQLDSVTTPMEVLVAIWNKASELLHESNAVMLAPGCADTARMVKSYSGTRPHLVVRKKGGQYSCDNACPNWRSMGICAHSVAAAEDNHDLQAYVRWFSNAKKAPNISKLATTNMPAGRGRKGGVPPRKKRKVQPPESRVSFATIAGLGNEVDISGSTTTVLSGNSVSTSHEPDDFYPRGTIANVVVTGGQLNILPHDSSFVTRYHQMPTFPPPLVHCSPSVQHSSSNPFILSFITGNIRVCHGCRQKYPKPPKPFDLCVKHQEWQKFGSLDDPQTRYGNVYYHCNIPCIKVHCPDFEPSMLQMPASLLVQLLPTHTQYLTISASNL